MNTPRTLLAAAFTLCAACASLNAHACDVDTGARTRDQVRAELAEARALGQLDQPGDAGATEAVLTAREAGNTLSALVLQACLAVEEQQLAHAGDDSALELEVYFEAGPYGPQMLLLTLDGAGRLRSADTVVLTAATVAASD